MYYPVEPQDDEEKKLRMTRGVVDEAGGTEDPSRPL
jgi:hypothetical protein